MERLHDTLLGQATLNHRHTLQAFTRTATCRRRRCISASPIFLSTAIRLINVRHIKSTASVRSYGNLPTTTLHQAMPHLLFFLSPAIRLINVRHIKSTASVHSYGNLPTTTLHQCLTYFSVPGDRTH